MSWCSPLDIATKWFKRQPKKLHMYASDEDWPIRRNDAIEMFWDWGIPTAASLIEVRKSVHLPLIASGGLRNGLEVAKCLAIGANMCAMALPFLKQAAISKEAVIQFVNILLNELKSVMYLVGTKDIKKLKESRYILTGPLAEWFK